MVKRLLKGAAWALTAITLAAMFLLALNWGLIQRVFLGGVRVYETKPPRLPDGIRRPAILVFSKTNGFRHEQAIPGASDMFEDIAKERGLGIFTTENGAAFSPEILARFDAVIFSNVTGDVFTESQRQALKDFVEGGGGFIGIHSAGDGSHNRWDWYTNQVIGAKFVGHPMNPQFQWATIRVEPSEHPATQSLPSAWRHYDEWYSFERSPREIVGTKVLATVDETSYHPGKFLGTQLAMGSDHPVLWWRCVGKGRAFYSAIGHTAQSFQEKNLHRLFADATAWAARLNDPKTCGSVSRSNLK